MHPEEYDAKSSSDERFDNNDLEPSELSTPQLPDQDERPVNPASSFHTNSDTVVAEASGPEIEVEAEAPSSVLPEKPLAPKKKSKIGLIVALVAAFLLLAGAAFATVLFFNSRNTPEVAVLEAVTQSIKAKHIKASGSVSFTAAAGSDSDVKMLSINLSSQSSLVPSAAQSTIKVTLSDDTTFELKLDGAFVKDGSLYFKISGIQDAVDNIDVSSDIALVLGFLSDAIQDIDAKWYKLSIDDFESDSDEAEAYSCLSRALVALADSETARPELAAIYEKHPFFSAKSVDIDTITKNTDGLSAYSISGDSAVAADFAAALKDSETISSLVSCLEDLDIEDYEDADIAEELDGTGKLSFLIDSGWGKHTLKGVIASLENDEVSMRADLRFEYPESLDIATPADAKPVSDIIGSLEEAITNIIMLSYCSEIPEIYWDSYGCAELVYPEGADTNI